MTTQQTRTVRCEKHGEVRWQGHLICEKCGAAYTTHDETLWSHAPGRCANCHARLLPVKIEDVFTKRVYFSARTCCPTCYDQANVGGCAVPPHDADNKRCTGETCPFHGPQLRKLARRAKRAQHLQAGSQKERLVVEMPDVAEQLANDPEAIGRNAARLASKTS